MPYAAVWWEACAETSGGELSPGQRKLRLCQCLWQDHVKDDVLQGAPCSKAATVRVAHVTVFAASAQVVEPVPTFLALVAPEESLGGDHAPHLATPAVHVGLARGLLHLVVGGFVWAGAEGPQQLWGSFLAALRAAWSVQTAGRSGVSLEGQLAASARPWHG